MAAKDIARGGLDEFVVPAHPEHCERQNSAVAGFLRGQNSGWLALMRVNGFELDDIFSPVLL